MCILFECSYGLIMMKTASKNCLKMMFKSKNLSCFSECHTTIIPTTGWLVNCHPHWCSQLQLLLRRFPTNTILSSSFFSLQKIERLYYSKMKSSLQDKHKRELQAMHSQYKQQLEAQSSSHFNDILQMQSIWK